jgi:hypothetical protein
LTLRSLARPLRRRYSAAMARKKRYLIATMADGYVKTQVVELTEH